MGKPVFYIVDVFAEEKYASNPLAVVKDVDVLSDKEMQQIAREMNYSETTFILSDEKQNCGFDVRILFIQGYREYTSFTDRTFNIDRTAMFFHNILCNEKTQT